MSPSKIAHAHFLNEYYGYPPGGPNLTLEQQTRMGQAVLIVAGADGELSELEYDFFMGFMACLGASEEALAAFENFDYASARLEDHLPKPSDNIPARLILHAAVRVSVADGEYSEKERDASARMAKALGINHADRLVIERLVDSEIALRNMRITVLGVETARGLGTS